MELRNKIIVDAETAQAEAALGRVADKAKQAGTDVDTAGKKAAGASAGFGQMERGLNSLERQIIRMAGAWVLYKGIAEGLKGADEIRSMVQSVDILTKTVGDGTKALDFFNSVQDRTRATATELMKVYSALAASNLGTGGFSPEGLKKFSVELVNAGTAAGVSTPKMLAFWEAVKRGEGARFDKDTMSRLGFNNETVKNLDTVREHIEELSAQGEKMGLTFESALAKIGSAWAQAFSRGEGEPGKGFTGLVDALTKPELLESISRVAHGVILIMEALPKAADAIVGTITHVIGEFMTAFGWAFEHIMGMIKSMLQALADATPAVGPGSKFKTWFQEGASKVAGYEGFGTGIKEQGEDLMAAALDRLKIAFGGADAAAKGFEGSLKTNADHLTTNKDKTHELEVAARKAAAEMAAIIREEAAFEQFQNRVNSIFDIGDENETPIDRKIKSLQHAFEQLADTAKEKMALAFNKMELSNALGDPKMYAAAKKLFEEYGAELDALPDKLKKATANEELKEATENVRKLADEWFKVDTAVTALKDAAGNAIASFENPGLNSFALNIASGMDSITQFMESLKSQPVTPFANDDQQRQWIADQVKTYEKIGQQFIKDNQTAAQRWADKVGNNLTNIFTDLALTGGQNFGQIAGQMFAKTVAEQAGKLQDVFSHAVIGAFGGDVQSEADYRPADHGGTPYAEYKAGQQSKSDAIASAISAAIGGIGQTIQMFQNAAKGQQTSVVGSTLSFAAIGASIGTSIAPGLGTIIGALVGALVGGLMASIANAKAKKELPFADYGVDSEGNPYIRAAAGHEANFAKNSAKELHDMMTQMRGVIDETTTEYVKLLIKLPHDALTIFAAQGSGAITRGAVDWSDDLAVLRQFSSDFTLWVNSILPHQLAERFRDQVGRGFEALGMSADAFSRFWTKVQDMDPKEGVAVMNNVADALIAFNNALQYANDVWGTFTGAFGTNNQIDSRGESTAGKTEFEQLMDPYKDKLHDLATEVQTLPFADAAAAAAQLGSGITELQANLTSFLNDILAKSKAISEKIADARFNAEMDAAKTPADKQALLKKRYEDDIYKVDHWKELGLSKDEVNRLINDAVDTAGKIYQMDPSGRKDWYEAQLNEIDKWQKGIFEQIGQDAIDATNALLASVQPAIDWFKSLPDKDHVGGSMDNVTTAANAAAEALWGVAGGKKSTGSSAASTASERSASAGSSSSSHASHVVVTVDDPGSFVHSVRASRFSR